MRIPRALYDEMVAHAQTDAPHECCGLVAVDGDRAARVVPTENVAHSELKFEIGGQELYDAWKAIEDAGLDIAIYHSHTRSEPYPSQTDVNFARDWPGARWLIFGLAGAEPTARIYEIRDGEVIEHELTVE